MKNNLSTIIYFAVLIVFVIILVLFAKANSMPVTLTILSFSFISQLWIIVISAFFIGILLAMSVSTYMIVRLKMKLSKLQSQEKELSKDLFSQSEE